MIKNVENFVNVNCERPHSITHNYLKVMSKENTNVAFWWFLVVCVVCATIFHRPCVSGPAEPGARGAVAPPKFSRINKEMACLALKALKVYYCWPPQTFLPSAGPAVCNIRPSGDKSKNQRRMHARAAQLYQSA